MPFHSPKAFHLKNSHEVGNLLLPSALIRNLFSKGHAMRLNFIPFQYKASKLPATLNQGDFSTNLVISTWKYGSYSCKGLTGTITLTNSCLSVCWCLSLCMYRQWRRCAVAKRNCYNLPQHKSFRLFAELMYPQEHCCPLHHDVSQSYLFCLLKILKKLPKKQYGLGAGSSSTAVI